MGTPRFLSVKEVAALINVSVKKVYKDKEQIPGYLMIAGMHRFDEEVLLQTLKQRALQPQTSIQLLKTNRKNQGSLGRHGLSR